MAVVSGFWFIRQATTTAAIDSSFTNAQTFLTAVGLPWSSFRGHCCRVTMAAVWDGNNYVNTLFAYALGKAQTQGISLAVRVMNGAGTSPQVMANGATIGASNQALNTGTGYTAIALNGTSAVAAQAGTWIVIDFVPGAGGQNVATFAKLSADLHVGDAVVNVNSVQPNTVPYAGLPATMDAAHTNLYLATGAFFYMDTSAPSSAAQNSRIVCPFWPDGTTNQVMLTHTSNLLTALAAWCRANAVPLLHIGWWGLGFSELALNLIIRQQPGYTYAVILQAHKDLFAASWNAIKPDAVLALEVPMSGGGPITSNTATPIVRDLVQWLYANYPVGSFYIQANGEGPVAGQAWTSPPYADFGQATWATEAAQETDWQSAPLQHALQSISQANNFNWDWVFGRAAVAHGNAGDPTPATGAGRAIVNQASYMEVYDQQLIGASNTAAQLASYMPKGANPWVPYVAPFEAVQQALRELMQVGGESDTQAYMRGMSASGGDLDSLEQLVRLKLTAGGHSANIKESLEATLRAAGATGESVEQMLRSSGLTGWS